MSETRTLRLTQFQHIAHDKLLQLGVMDTHGTASDFKAVENKVKVLSANLWALRQLFTRH